jgi:uncharacterized membrane protein YeaQ/YmgE (transglycosylase-associated protein family)
VLNLPPITEIRVGTIRLNLLYTIIIGVIGAFIWIASVLNLPPITEIRVGTIRLNLLYTIIGSTLLLVLALRSGRRWLWINRK